MSSLSTTPQVRIADLVSAAQEVLDEHERAMAKWETARKVHIEGLAGEWMDTHRETEVALRDALTAHLKRKVPLTIRDTELRRLLSSVRDNVLSDDPHGWALEDAIGRKPTADVKGMRTLIAALGAIEQTHITVSQLRSLGFKGSAVEHVFAARAAVQMRADKEARS